MTQRKIISLAVFWILIILGALASLHAPRQNMELKHSGKQPVSGTDTQVNPQLAQASDMTPAYLQVESLKKQPYYAPGDATELEMGDLPINQLISQEKIPESADSTVSSEIPSSYKKNPEQATATESVGTHLEETAGPMKNTRPYISHQKKHKIADGDTLESISVKYYYKPDMAQQIYELNRDVLSNPEVLPLGKTLVLPDKEMK